MEQADENNVRTTLRRMASALVLHRYEYSGPYVVSEEDRVFGIAPAEQSESQAEPPECKRLFNDEATRLLEFMDLLARTRSTCSNNCRVSITGHPEIPIKYRISS